MKLKSVDQTILVQSSSIDLGDVLPEYARSSILRMAGKYFGRLNAAHVHFHREGITYRCTVTVQMGTLRMMSGEAKSTDIYAAFRTALERVAKQLRRAKRELREDKAERVKDMILREPPQLHRRAAWRADRSAPELQPVLDPGDYQMPRELERGRLDLIAAE